MTKDEVTTESRFPMFASIVVTVVILAAFHSIPALIVCLGPLVQEIGNRYVGR